MRQIASFQEANDVLKSYIPRTSQKGVYTLERMTELMEKLGNPQEKYKVIHIAGTSGKTSTAYYITSILKAHGARVGLTVSPHVDEVNERVQIGLKPLSEQAFCKNLTRFINVVGQTGIKPTYFELLAAFAYWYFAKARVDYAVVEVGLGGLLDGTNVINRHDKVCVITDIGLDHTSILGTDLSSIAAQKAGIIHPQNIVFAHEQDEEVMKVLRDIARQQQAELHEILPKTAKELPVQLPLFQRRNWYLALNVARYVVSRDELGDLSEEQLAESVRTYIPARMEVIKFKGKTIIVDGSHNPQKLKTLVKSLKAKFPEVKYAILIGMLAERSEQARAILKELEPMTGSLTATSFFVGQDIPRESMDPIKIVAAAKKVGISGANYVKDPREALESLVSGSGKYILVTGSFFLLNHIRPLILNKHD